jgi:energy-coupling factor transporter ATP-binding protein EcfA2
MTLHPGLDELAQMLAAARAEERLPEDLLEPAARVAAQLATPARVALAGPPGTGKSRLLNALAGFEVVPRGLVHPTLMLSRGERDAAVRTQLDGSQKAEPHTILAELLTPRTVLADLRMSLPALAHLSLLEVRLTEEAEESAALPWLVAHSDIVVWVTRDFAPWEAAVWEALPTTLARRSHLVLADAAPDAARRAAWHADALSPRPLAALAIDPEAAEAARGSSGTADADLLNASGLARLIAVLKRQFAFRDSLSRAAATAILDRAAPPARSARSRPRKARPEPQALPPAAIRLSAEGRRVLASVVERLSDLGDRLIDLAANAGQAPGQAILETLSEEADEIASVLDQAPREDEILPLRKTVYDVADIVQLMQMERGEAAAEDAVCLFLQLKREVQEKIAA